jgi:hypothetical protein
LGGGWIKTPDVNVTFWYRYLIDEGWHGEDVQHEKGEDLITVVGVGQGTKGQVDDGGQRGLLQQRFGRGQAWNIYMNILAWTSRMLLIYNNNKKTNLK